VIELAQFFITGKQNAERNAALAAKHRRNRRAGGTLNDALRCPDVLPPGNLAYNFYLMIPLVVIAQHAASRSTGADTLTGF